MDAIGGERNRAYHPLVLAETASSVEQSAAPSPPTRMDSGRAWAAALRALPCRVLADRGLRQALMLVATLRLWLGLVAGWGQHTYPVLAGQTERIFVVNPWEPALLPQPETWQAVIGGPWARWDALEYQHIAVAGYQPGGREVVFFPLFPELERLVGRVTGGPLIGGLAISTVCMVIGLWLLHQLVRRDFEESIADRTILYVALAPTAFFFLAGYTEALFLALSVGAFLAARRRWWWLAGLVAALAAVCRFQGTLLLVPLGIEAITEMWERRRAGLFPIRPVHVALILPVLSVATWFLYVATVLKVPGGPLGAERDLWGNVTVWPWRAVIDGVRSVAHNPATDAVQALELGAVAGLLAACVVMVRGRFPPSYAAYTLVLTAAMTSREVGGAAISISRFALVAFPAFVVLAMWGRRAWVDRAVLTLFAAMLTLGTFHFAHWGFLG